MAIHVANGVSIKSLFKPYIEVRKIDNKTSLILARESAVFSNWIPFKRQIEDIGLVQKQNLVIDLSETKLVDHSVMEKLDEIERDFEQEGLTFEIRGLEAMQPLSDHSHAARKVALARMRRLTIVVDDSLEHRLEAEFIRCGASGYTSLRCSGDGRRHITEGRREPSALVRVEVIAPIDVCGAMLDFLRCEILPEHHVTVCVETVDVVRIADFMAAPPKAVAQQQHT